MRAYPSQAPGKTGRRRCRGRQPAGPTCRWIGISGGSKTVATVARSAAVPIPDEARPAAELTVQEVSTIKRRIDSQSAS